MRPFIYLFGILVLLSFGARAEWLDSDGYSDSEPLESPLFGALELQYAPIRYPNYTWVDDVRSSKGGQGVRAALEWIIFPADYGKLGLGTGFSFQRIENVALGADRTATLTLYPVEAYLTYRFDYVPDQVLVPFVKGGARYTFVQQASSTGGGREGTAGHASWDYGAGLQLCLDVFDANSAQVFDKSSGVNATFAVFEYLRSRPMNQRTVTSLDHEELRAGLRFEF